MKFCNKGNTDILKMKEKVNEEVILFNSTKRNLECGKKNTFSREHITVFRLSVLMDGSSKIAQRTGLILYL